MRKPKGWYRRYELVRRLVEFIPGQPKERWAIVHYFGRDKGAGVRYLDSDPGVNIPDNLLIKWADLDNVTVPVYVVRGKYTSDPYFGGYYGQP